VSDLSSSLPDDYGVFLNDLKDRIRNAQIRAALAVSRELLQLYWKIGLDLSQKLQQEGWGKGLIERLARDLQSDFPGVKGFSARNLWRMRAFYQAYPESEVLPQAVAGLPWGHNILLLEKAKDPEERFWYARAAAEYGWSRNVLAHQIDSGLYRRRGKAPSNFARTLPPAQSDLAQQALKDPYNFDFLTLADEAKEQDLERGLLDHLREFLLELGVGFAFVGSQYRLKVGDEDFFVDLLFYHYRLHCFVVIDRKMKAFRPEDAGKLNFYLSAVDDLLRHPQDEPSIGILLCRGKNQTVVEYALRDMSKPMGVSEYRLAEELPSELEGNLPSIEALEAELDELQGKSAELPETP
jgi:predicted nuclease of restriction endonuclease-like (RecB) superfamily